MDSELDSDSNGVNYTVGEQNSKKGVKLGGMRDVMKN